MTKYQKWEIDYKLKMMERLTSLFFSEMRELCGIETDDVNMPTDEKEAANAKETA